MGDGMTGDWLEDVDPDALERVAVELSVAIDDAARRVLHGGDA